MKIDFLQLPIKKILLFLFILRIPLLLTPYDYNDSILLYTWSQFFFNGDLPYRDFGIAFYAQEGFVRVQPVLFYYMVYFFALISGNNFVIFGFILKLIWNLFDFGVMYLLYIITKDRFLEDVRKILVLFYGLSASSFLVQGYIGVEESITSFFGLLGLFYFQKHRYGYSALFIAIGIAAKLMPIFYLIFIIPYFVSRKEFKNLTLFLVEIFLIYLLLSLPYLILCPMEFIQSHFDIIERSSSMDLIPFALIEPMTTGLFQIPVLLIDVSLKLLIQLMILAMIFVYFFLKPGNIRQIYEKIYIIFLFLPLMTLSNHLRNAYWLLPFLLYMLGKQKLFQTDNNLNQFVWSLGIFNFIFGIVCVIIHYNSTWADYSTLINGTAQLQAFLIILTVYLMIWIPLILSFNGNKEFARYFAFIHGLFNYAFVITFGGDLGLNSWIKLIGLSLIIIIIILAIFHSKFKED